jgi:hypothetical protein
VALQLFPPGIAPAPGKEEAYTAIQFTNASVNNPLDKLVFLPPITPPFWRKVVVQAADGQGDNPQDPGVAVPQATGRAPSAPRK